MQLRIRHLDAFALHLTVLPLLLIFSQFAGHFAPGLVTPLYAMAWVGIVMATALNFAEGRFGRVAALVILVLIIAGYIARFGMVTAMPTSITSLAGFAGLASFATFSRYAGRFSTLLTTVWIYGAVYLAVYLAISLMTDFGLVRPTNAMGTGLIMFDRNLPRAYLANGLIAFVGLVSLACLNARQDRRLHAVVLAGVVWALFQAESRFFMAAMALIGAGYILTRSGRVVVIGSFVAACAQGCWFIWCLFDYARNPFAWFVGDGSGRARAMAFEVARSEVPRNGLFGVGIPFDRYEATWLSVKNFSSADISYAGILYAFGWFGLALYLISMLVIVVRANRLGQPSEPLLTGLAISGAVAMLSGAIWFTVSSMIFALIAASLLAPSPYSLASSQRPHRGSMYDRPGGIQNSNSVRRI